MTIPELLAQLEKLSDAELKKLIHTANVVLDARDEQQCEQCVEEMICQRCGQELDSEYGLSGQCSCGCHQCLLIGACRPKALMYNLNLGIHLKGGGEFKQKTWFTISWKALM